MSRSGYSEDYGDDYPGQVNLYRGSVTRAIAGKRGQAFLRELANALDAMPEKRLGANSFQPGDGPVCTLGCIAKARGVDTSRLDRYLADNWDDDYADVSDDAGDLLGIARCMAAEIMYLNDDDFGLRTAGETPEQRWTRMRAWVQSKLEVPHDR